MKDMEDGKESSTFDNRYIVQRSINISGSATGTLREALSTIVKYFTEFENLAVAILVDRVHFAPREFSRIHSAIVYLRSLLHFFTRATLSGMYNSSISSAY